MSIASLSSSKSQASQSVNSPAWLDVIKLSKRDIEAVYDSEKMKRRANRNYILGCSIATTMDYNSNTEFAKALLAIFNDAETMGEGNDRDKAKMVRRCLILRLSARERESANLSRILQKNFFKASIRGTRRGGLSDWESGLAATGSGGMEFHQGHVSVDALSFFFDILALLIIITQCCSHSLSIIFRLLLLYLTFLWKCITNSNGS